MSKRLQVVLTEREHRQYQRVARHRGLTLSEWVRGLLREAIDAQSAIAPVAKLEAVRRAAEHEHPSPDIDQMLAEIEAGYLDAAP